jgi:hypothetical protein
VSTDLLKRGSIVHEKVDAVVKGCHNHPIDNVPELASAPFNQSFGNHCHIVINPRHSLSIPPHPLNHPNRRFHRDILRMTNIQAVVHSALSMLSSGPHAGLSILHHMTTRSTRGRGSNRFRINCNWTQVISNQVVGSRLDSLPRLSVDGLVMVKTRS